jgi:hypothetical protein
MPGGYKPPGKSCEHCAIGQGCKIYDRRPEQCRGFECIWLRDKTGRLPDDLRPDRSHVLLIPAPDGLGIVAEVPNDHPDAWRHPTILAVLKEVANAGYMAMARCGARHWAIGSKGISEVPADNVWLDASTHMFRLKIPERVVRALGLGELRREHQNGV